MVLGAEYTLEEQLDREQEIEKMLSGFQQVQMHKRSRLAALLAASATSREEIWRNMGVTTKRKSTGTPDHYPSTHATVPGTPITSQDKADALHQQKKHKSSNATARPDDLPLQSGTALDYLPALPAAKSHCKSTPRPSVAECLRNILERDIDCDNTVGMSRTTAVANSANSASGGGRAAHRELQEGDRSAEPPGEALKRCLKRLVQKHVAASMWAAEAGDNGGECGDDDEEGEGDGELCMDDSALAALAVMLQERVALGVHARAAEVEDAMRDLGLL